jgi:histone-lysine N-methyltransferase SETD3
MRQSMNEVCDLINSNTFTLEDFLWAYTTIDSRAFKLTELGTTLIPLADLANHVSFAEEANLFSMGIDKQTDRFILKATKKKILDGEELCLKYNNELVNWQLLLYYGFAIENNPFDSILIELKINENDTYEMEMKKMLLLNLSKSKIFYRIISNIFLVFLGDDLHLEYELKIIENEPIINENLLATLRLIVMSNEELEQYNISNLNELLTSIVNIDNERRVLNKLLVLLNDLKEVSYTTTLEENLNRFQSNQLNDDERYSLIYLIGQKKIIENACRWIDNALSQLK